MNLFIPAAHAAETTSTTVTTTATPQGLSIDPTVIGFQALNFIILIAVLNAILYKPLTKLLSEREQKIKEGVENAERAEGSLREARSIREDMMKSAKVESQALMDRAKKDGEGLKNSIVTEAQDQAKKIIDNGHQVLTLEKAKTMEELKAHAVGLIIKTVKKWIPAKTPK